MTNATEVQTQALALPDEARQLTITTDADYQDAARWLRERCKAVQKLAAETFDPICATAHAAHKEALSQRKKVLAPVEEAERIIKRLMAGYSQRREQAEREREAEQRQAQQELIEKERLDEAARLERQGRKAEAQAALEKAVTAAPVAVAPAPKLKAEGVTIRKRWAFRIVDTSAVKREFLAVDERRIRAVVKSMGADAVALVGGIEVYQEAEVAARAS